MAWKTLDSIPAESVSEETRVHISKRAASTILFAKSGATTIRQVEMETVTEYRALTEASAKSLAGVVDGTTQTEYYASFDGVLHTISVLSGTKTEKTAARSNEANGWTLTVREVAYSTFPASLPSGWSTSASSSSAQPVSTTTSISHSRSHVASYGGCTLISTKEVTTGELYSYATSAAANTAAAEWVAALDSGESALTSLTVCCSWQTSGIPGGWQYATVNSGVLKYATVRPSSTGSGWMIETTKEKYGWTQSPANGITRNDWPVSGGSGSSTTSATLAWRAA